MNVTLIDTTLEQREAAKEAARKRYEYNRWTPNRAGWLGGKCPVSEYRGILGEIGAANHLGLDWTELVLFSTNPDDFTTPDLGVWEVKAGSTFSDKDIAKGAKYILWVNPWNNGQVFDCGYDTCHTLAPHKSLSGQVEILGWTDLTEDLHLCQKPRGTYYVPTGNALRSATTLPVMKVAA